MTESGPKSELVNKIRNMLPACVVFRHEDKSTGAVPDISVSWRKVTSWWEVKHYNNAPFKSKGNQELLCRNLAVTGHCHYIIYEQRGIEQRTLIVEPKSIERWQTAPNLWSPGFAHLWVIEQICRLHLGHTVDLRQ